MPLRDVPGTEAYIKQRSVIAARRLGYIVHSTSSFRSANSKGIADTYTTHRTWGNRWVAVDFKSLKGTPTPEQQKLVDVGVLHIATSLDEFLSILRNVDL